MAVCYGVSQTGPTCMCAGGNPFSSQLGKGALNLPCLSGIPDQNCTVDRGMWFDLCSQKIRFALSDGSGWSAGGALPYNINQGNGGGTQNAAYHYGGTLGTGNPAVSCTAEYNGTSWSGGGALPAVRRLLFRGCVGTQNAGIAIFGFNAPSNQSTTYEYNGTTWSSGGSGACTIRNGAAFGTQNSAMAAGGFTTAVQTGTQEYNGTSWSGGGALITARQGVQGGGQSQNQGWAAGGADSPGSTLYACTETYNGAAWATSGALPTAQQIGGSSGRQAYGFFAGGRNPSASIVACVLLFDGYLWTSTCSLITAVACNAAAGDGNRGIVFSGQSSTPAVVSCTQEYNNPFKYYNVGV